MGQELFKQVWDRTRPAWANPTGRFRVLLVMAALAEGPDEEVVATVDHVARYAGISGRQAKRYMAELKAQGWVTVTEPGRGQGVPNVYRVSIPDGWEPIRPDGWWAVPE
jgi:hypothetical protein